MALEFAERIRRIPVYPAADGYSLAGDIALLASNESPYAPLPEVVEAAARALVGRQPLPRPDQRRRCARALSDRYGVPSARIAIGNGSCDILLAAGEALLEPGAEVVYAWPSFSIYPHLAAAVRRPRDRGAPRRRAAPRPRGDGARDHGRDAPGDRLQPEQPDVDGARRSTRSPTSSAAVPRHVARDPRRGLLRVQRPRRPGRVDRTAQAPPEPRPAADVLEGLRPVRAARRLRAVRQRRTSGRRSTRCASRSSATPPRRRPRVEALRHQDEVAAPRRAHARRAHRARGGTGRPGDRSRPESQANFVWFDLPGDDPAERERDRGARPGRARRARARRRRRSGARARCA